MNSSRGFLVSVEGLEGAGKSTLIQGLKAFFQRQNTEVTCLREPGGTKFGERIRELLLHQDEMTPLSEALLFASSRCQLLEEIILPGLKQKNHLLIADRFVHSSLAYQGYGRELGVDLIEAIHQLGPLTTRPDLCIYLDIPLEESWTRQGKRGSKKDRIELAGLDFFQKVERGFKSLIAQNPAQFLVLDAKLAPDELVHLSSEEIKKRWKQF